MALVNVLYWYYKKVPCMIKCIMQGTFLLSKETDYQTISSQKTL